MTKKRPDCWSKEYEERNLFCRFGCSSRISCRRNTEKKEYQEYLKEKKSKATLEMSKDLNCLTCEHPRSKHKKIVHHGLDDIKNCTVTNCNCGKFYPKKSSYLDEKFV